MPLIDPVQPGNLISSSLFNDLLLKLENLEQRVVELETQVVSPTALAIHGFDPQDQARVGEELLVLGQNFAIPVTQNVVTVNGVQVSEILGGSTVGVLRFVIPPLGVNIPAIGLLVPVTVKAGNEEDTALYRVLPALQGTGPKPVIKFVNNEDVTTGAVPNVETGETLTIVGENFASTPGANIVQIAVLEGAGKPPVFPVDAASGEVGSFEVMSTSNENFLEVSVPADAFHSLLATPIKDGTLIVTVGAETDKADITLTIL